MKRIIFTGIAALALTGAALASEGGDSFPQDKTELFNVQRGVVTQQAPAQRGSAYTVRGYDVRTMEGALAYAPSHADREASQK